MEMSERPALAKTAWATADLRNHVLLGPGGMTLSTIENDGFAVGHAMAACRPVS